jgi:hypothetical protein
MSEQADITPLLNAFLNAIKQRENLATDTALARYLGTHPMNISRWRKGEVGASTAILLPVALRSVGDAQITPTLN